MAAFTGWLKAFRDQTTREFLVYTKAHNLSMSQFFAMMHIGRSGACAVSDLSDNLGVTNAAVSQMLDRLVKQELIVRTEDPEDRRMKRIELTDRGKKMIEGSVNARMQWFDQIGAVMSAENRRSAITGLSLLTDAINKLEKREQ